MSKKMSFEDYHKRTSDIKFEISYLETREMKDNEVTRLKVNDLQRELKQIERNYRYQNIV